MIKKETLSELSEAVAKDSVNHGYEDYLWPTERTITKAMCEVAESVIAFRDRRIADMNMFESLLEEYKSEGKLDREKSYTIAYGACIKDTLQDELADVVIYLLLASFNLGKIHAKFDKVDESGLSYSNLVVSDNDDYVIFAGTLIRKMAKRPSLDMILDVIRTIEAWMTFHYSQQKFEDFLNAKIEYNRYRPFLHGRTYDPTV